MNRRIFLLGAGGTAACTRDTRPRLNIFNWSDYIAPNTIANFEREFNVRVRYGTYESNEEMLARVASGDSGWDIAFPTDYLIGPMRDSHLLARLDHSKLPNLHYLEPAFQKPAWDPELAWSVPYMVTAAGIVYSRLLVPPPTSWSDLWNPRWRGRMTMLDDPFDLLGACLKKLSLSVNTHSEPDLRKAQKEALGQKSLIRAYVNAEVRDQLVSGDVLAAQLWNTTAQQAIDQAPHLAFVYPSEGYAVYPDAMVILRESPRQDLAHQFLNYILRPDIAAPIAIAARTTTTDAGARALLPSEHRNNAALYPPPDVLSRGEWAQSMPPAVQRLRDRIWTEIKSA